MAEGARVLGYLEGDFERGASSDAGATGEDGSRETKRREGA